MSHDLERDREGLYAELFAAAPDGFAVHQILHDDEGRPADYRFLAVNAAFTELTGLEPDVVGRTVREVLPGIEESWISAFGQVALSGEPLHFEQHSQPLGRHFRVSAFRPRPGLFAVLFSDVTDLKRREEQLEVAAEELESRVERRTAALVAAQEQLQAEAAAAAAHAARLRQTILQSPLPTMLHAEDGEVLLLSDTWSALTGYSAEEIPTVGDWLERAFGDRAAAMRDAVAALFDAPGPVQQEDVVVRTRSGEERIWSFSSAPLGRLEDGRRLVISKAHDVTERRRAQTVIGELHDALQEKLREVEASNLELEAFSYSVSHDLRAPLRAIDGFCRLLEEDCADQLPVEGRRYLDVVRDNARRMGQLIDDLLAFSRLGRKPLEPREVAMEALVRGAYAELRQEDDGREVALEVGDLPPCHGDPALLGQVVLNLLANALKFSRDRRPARIEVGWQPSEGGGAYFVRDNGVGFDMRYADKLFGVFQRLHRDDEFAGTGVGLALVQRIVHRHGGRIWASAEPGLGATFYFTLGGESEP